MNRQRAEVTRNPGGAGRLASLALALTALFTSCSSDWPVGSLARTIAGTDVRDWNWLQQCGGLRVLDPITFADGTVVLPVACDVSGTRKITIEPTENSAVLVVVRTDAVVIGDHIRIDIVTGLAGARGLTSCAPPPTFAGLAHGDYWVEYANPDGTTVLLRTVHIQPQPAGPLDSSPCWRGVEGSWFRSRIAIAQSVVDGVWSLAHVPPQFPGDSTFTPDATDVLRAERGIVGTLLQTCWTSDGPLPDLGPTDHASPASGEIAKIVAHFGDFDAQVGGLVIDGHKRLVFNFFMRFDWPENEDDWVEVMDGGYAFWRIQYDLDTDRCLLFESNGYA